MPFGGTFGIGAPGDIQLFILDDLSPNAGGGGITRVNPDTQTALYIALQTLPAGQAGWGINERLRAYLQTQYSTTNQDLQTLYARWLRDIKS